MNVEKKFFRLVTSRAAKFRIIIVRKSRSETEHGIDFSPPLQVIEFHARRFVMQELYVKSISKADLAARNWLDWRDEFQRAIDESSFTKPTPRRMSYFFTLLLAEIESALKEKFAQTKAHLIFAPSWRKIIKTGYKLLITDLEASPSDVKENIDEAQTFFNSVKVQETKFLFSEWVEAAVLKEYETKARTWSRRLVASRNDAYYKTLFGKSPHDARNYLLASLAGYWRWGELHLKELKENPDLSRLLDYAVERIRRVADELGFDDCERFLEEYPNLTDWELRDFQRLAKDVVPEVDYFVKDHLYKTFARKAGVPYDGPPSPLDPAQKIPRDVLFLYRLKRWENWRRGIRKLIEGASSSFEPSEFNVDQVCYYISNALRAALAESLRQEIPECPDDIVDAEIDALVQSGYASMKSVEFANALVNQRAFDLEKEEEFRTDTISAIDALEQCIGEKVLSYRAPAFSIGNSNKWAFEILAECGIERDASIFPATRDFGGFANFGQKAPSIVKCGGVKIKEFPICTTHIAGKDIAYSGGGYFRFFPLWFVKKEMKNSLYAMTYFHIDDLIPESERMLTKKEFEDYFKESGTFFNRYKRHIKSNLGKKNAFNKMSKLITAYEFQSLKSADKLIEWQNAPVVEL